MHSSTKHPMDTSGSPFRTNLATIFAWMLLSAVSVSAAPLPTVGLAPTTPQAIQPRGPTISINLCIAKRFKDCHTVDAPVGQCYNFPTYLSNKVSSYLIPKKTGCIFYDKPNCDESAFHEWTTDSDRDLRDLFNRIGRNDLYSSMKCTNTP